MKVKSLRYKDTKEFIHIQRFSGTYEVFTSNTPNIQPVTATMELIKEIYPLEECYFDNFDNIELVEYDLIESGDVGADIRNKLSSSNNLVELLKEYFNKEGVLDKKITKKFIKKEMKQTKKSIEYLANLL